MPWWGARWHAAVVLSWWPWQSDGVPNGTHTVASHHELVASLDHRGGGQGSSIRMHTSVMPASAAKAAAARYLSCLRPLEILVLQSPPLLGAVVALRQPSIEQAGPLAVLVAANVCLVAHIFVL